MKTGDHVRITKKLIEMVMRGGTVHHADSHPHAGKTGVITELLQAPTKARALVKPRALVELDPGQGAGGTVVVSLEYLEPCEPS